MADHSGTTSGDITINDGDTIGATASLTIAPGHIATVTPGATVSVYDGRGITIQGSFIAQGTLENNIIFQSQNVDPTSSQWDGIGTGGNGCAVTLNYVIVENANECTLEHEGTFDIGPVIIRKGLYGLMWNAIVSTATWTVEKVFIQRCKYPVYMDTNDSAPAVTIRKIWMEDNDFSMQGRDTEDFIMSDIVIMNDEDNLNFWGGFNMTFQDWYIKNKDDTHAIYTNDATTDINLKDCVFFCCGGSGVAANPGIIDSDHCDYIECMGWGLYNYGGATINSDYDYIAGCVGRPSRVVDISADTQVFNISSRTNIQSTPNKPLTVDNISEGTPDANSITITFDCAAGGTGKRLKGLGFIKYGTVSGSYDMQSFLPSPDLWGLYWIEWYTDLTWKSTGHSVTLDNLKLGITYYYKCCFVDPFGRIAESSEGTFTTVSYLPVVSNVVSSNYSPDTDDSIAITATVTNSPLHVACEINDQIVEMIQLSGTTYTTSNIKAKTFGTCTNEAVTVFATNADGGDETDADNTITITSATGSHYFRETRNIELSLEKLLTDEVNANWSAVTITKNFTEATEKTLPVICFRLINTNSKRLEVGNDNLLNSYLVTVDLFTKSDGQRLDLTDFVLNVIKDGWVYYEHSNDPSDKSTLLRSEDGRVHIVDFMRNEKVDFGDNTDKRDRFRQTIVFICRKT